MILGRGGDVWIILRGGQGSRTGIEKWEIEQR
jgi:hypothetical protein